MNQKNPERKDFFWWRFHFIWRPAPKKSRSNYPDRGIIYYPYPYQKPYSTRTIDFFTFKGLFTIVFHSRSR